MEITVRIDNGDARVFVRQIFANHTGKIEEGNYIFALPSQATVSDFAVWDGPTRIPAVVLERKRAEEIYTQLKQQAIDPGLLQMGERGSEEAKRSSVFSARIVPIQPHGTKRLEIEYHQSIPVENLKSYFAIPLRPDAYSSQAARHLRINFELHSEHAISNFQAAAKAFPLKLDENTPHSVKGSFQGDNVNLSEDFVATYDLDAAGADTLNVLTYRNPVSAQPAPTETARQSAARTSPGSSRPKRCSGMERARPQSQVETQRLVRRKLWSSFSTHRSRCSGKSWSAAIRLWRACCVPCGPRTDSTCLLFNNQVQIFQPAPVAADPAAVQHALDFVRSSKLRGGTDLQKALQTGLQQCSASAGASPYLILLSDGGATRGPIQNGKLASWYADSWKRLPETQRPRTYIFAVGDDANLPLLKRAGAAGRFAGARALDRTRRVQAEFVSLQDRPQPDRRIESGRGPGIGSGHGLPAAEFHLRRFDRFLGGTLPGARRKT